MEKKKLVAYILVGLIVTAAIPVTVKAEKKLVKERIRLIDKSILIIPFKSKKEIKELFLYWNLTKGEPVTLLILNSTGYEYLLKQERIRYDLLLGWYVIERSRYSFSNAKIEVKKEERYYFIFIANLLDEHYITEVEFLAKTFNTWMAMTFPFLLCCVVFHMLVKETVVDLKYSIEERKKKREMKRKEVKWVRKTERKTLIICYEEKKGRGKNKKKREYAIEYDISEWYRKCGVEA